MALFFNRYLNGKYALSLDSVLIGVVEIAVGKQRLVLGYRQDRAVAAASRVLPEVRTLGNHVAKTASVNGPCIICADAEIRHCAYIRGSAIVGRGAVVGNSTELKNCILFDGVQVPHYNYVGDSVLGYRSHMGAGAITSNVKSDKTPVTVSIDGDRLETGRKKFGAMLGDFVEVGCNSVLNPGTVIGRCSNVYPLSSVRGYVAEESIYKAYGCVVKKESR